MNGRLFLNNVSLGIYGEAVRRAAYRDAKLRTLLETAEQVLGPSGEAPALRLVDDVGREHTEPAVVLVSNNPYASGEPFFRGTRPALNSGRLGILVLDAPATGPHPREGLACGPTGSQVARAGARRHRWRRGGPDPTAAFRHPTGSASRSYLTTPPGRLPVSAVLARCLTAEDCPGPEIVATADRIGTGAVKLTGTTGPGVVPPSVSVRAELQTGWTGPLADIIRRRHYAVGPIGDVLRSLHPGDRS